MLSVAEHLGPAGPLAAAVPDYAPRAEQQEMAEAVARAIEDYRVLVCEAGTGTGKTFAYLVPGVLSGRKVIVSTGTKSLQEQLYYRDLPVVLKALRSPARVALLKGRANYLCRHRLSAALADPTGQRPEVIDDLYRVADWATATGTGDISEVADVSEDAPAWRQATSTADSCLGQDCPELPDCFVLQARRAAMEADVVVVNHHLFFADMVLREEGFGELLPGADAVVLDEAHQVPEIATQFFGNAVSARQLLELARDTITAHHQEAGDTPELVELAAGLDRRARALRAALPAGSLRMSWPDLTSRQGAPDALRDLAAALHRLGEALAAVSERGRDLTRCHRRCLELGERLSLTTGALHDDYLQWVEVSHRSFTFHITPLDISTPFAGTVSARKCAWIFTSATLAVAGRFEHFAKRLGLENQEECLWESPFDFAHQALCYIPAGLPEPNAENYTARVVEAAVPVLKASGGRAFLLFTSYRALREAARELPHWLDYPLFVQGDAPRSRLLEQFRSTPEAVLLGTSSFWEGVDVRGEALSCVVIDRLPFGSPSDPLLQARSRSIRERGGNPFVEHQLPQAVIALKQGVGRLIRDPSDRGVLVLCDPRLRVRSYGRVFLASLPPVPVTEDVDEVRRFFDP